MGAEKLASLGIRSPDCPNRSESLYLLLYPTAYGFGYTHNKGLLVAKFVYHYIKVEIELFEYTNFNGGDCGLSQCPVAVFAWTEREIQYPPAGRHETRLKFEM
jgi:hypothetical protein